MQSTASNPIDYIEGLPEDRKTVMSDLRNLIVANLPNGFKESMQYGMISYVVPHEIYPDGYHCDPKQALPFLSIASQKNYISVYHMGIYTDDKLLTWFKDEYSKQFKAKLDMGKSCIRFKKPEHIPVKLIGELASKITPQEWVETYENRIRK